MRIIAIVVLGMAVNIYIPIAPSILGAWVDYQGMTMDVAGRLTSYDFWGATVSSVVAVFLLHRPGWNLRATMLACLLLVITTSGASVWLAGNIPALATVRLINGVGSGLGFTVACVAVIGTPHIERTYAILYGSPFLISGIGLALLPLAYRLVGIEGAFYGMGVVNLLGLALLPYFPRTVERTERVPETPRGIFAAGAHWLAILALAGLLLHYVFNSGIWAYFERLGVTAGMSAETTGAILGPSMAAAIFGMIAASLLGDRWGYIRPIYFGIVVITASTLALLGSSSELVFGLGTAVFNASITFVTPYMVAILALLIPSGLGVTTANVATIAGFSTGPFLISFFVAGGSFTPAILVTAGGFVLVLTLFVLFVRLLGRQPGFERLKSQCLVWTPTIYDPVKT
jgi:Major Facilitator Superfamily